MRYAVPGTGSPLSVTAVTLTGVCGGVDLTSPSIKPHPEFSCCIQHDPCGGNGVT